MTVISNKGNKKTLQNCVFQKSIDLFFFLLSLSVADDLERKVAAKGNNICFTPCDWLLGEKSSYRVLWVVFLLTLLFFFPPLSPYFNLTELAERDLRPCLLRREASCDMWMQSQCENMDVGALSIDEL